MATQSGNNSGPNWWVIAALTVAAIELGFTTHENVSKHRRRRAKKAKKKLKKQKKMEKRISRSPESTMAL